MPVTRGAYEAVMPTITPLDGRAPEHAQPYESARTIERFRVAVYGCVACGAFAPGLRRLRETACTNARQPDEDDEEAFQRGSYGVV